MGYKKREGFSLFIIVILLFLVGVYLTLMFQPLLNITISSKEIEDNLVEEIKERTGLERVYAQLERNISFRGSLDYRDINKNYKISTLKEEKREVELYNINSFQVYNSTNIGIELEHYVIDSEESSSYDIQVTYDNQVIREYSGIDESVVINIVPDFLYDQKTNKTNYGNYGIDIITDNCIVDTIVTYNELDYREILVEDETTKRVVIAENDMSIGGIKQLYIRVGGK